MSSAITAGSMATVSSGGAIPSPTGCSANISPDIRDVTGLSGRVCSINYAPDLVNVQSCCNDGAEVRVQDGCTQYCETDDGDFLSCVTNMLKDPPPTHIGAFCREINEDGSISANSTLTGGVSSSAASTTTEGALATGAAPAETSGPANNNGVPAAGSLSPYSFAFAVVAAAVTFGFYGLS